MQNRPIIKIIFSSLLALVFAVAVTPKILLHDLAAHHKDVIIQLDDTHLPQINKVVFQCDLDHQVVESPFTFQLADISFYLSPIHVLLQDNFSQGFQCAQRFIYGLRGPPSIA